MAPLRDDAIPVTMFLVHHHPAFSLEESEGAAQKGHTAEETGFKRIR